MLQNASFTVFNVCKLLREKQEGAGGGGGEVELKLSSSTYLN